jgi:hypothetical protein
MGAARADVDEPVISDPDHAAAGDTDHAHYLRFGFLVI